MAADLKQSNILTYTEKGSQDDSSIKHHISAFRADPWWKFGGRDRIFIPTREETSKREPEDESVFSNVKARDIYKPIEKYEGRHRFDVNATWSDNEEKKLVRRLDLRICLWTCVMYFALQLDRGNINQALSDNMLESIQMISWSAVAAVQYHLNGKTTFYIWDSLQMSVVLSTKMSNELTDSLEAIIYLSYFYKNNELPIRLAWFWTSYVGTNIIGSFLAYVILHLREHNGKAGWRYLFAIEGGITAAVGVISWLYLPPSPTQTKRNGIKGLLRNKEGWFTEREEVIMVTRILRDDPAGATMHNRQAVNWKLLWESLKDYDMWLIYLIGLTWTIPVTPGLSYLTLIIRSLGFDVFETNLLTIPSSVLFMLQLLFWTWFSEKFNQRFFVGLDFANAKWSRYALISRRDSIWNRMSQDGRLEYLATTKDKGNKRLDFRFAH
ncbi:MAG: hypothetical protein LQ342_006435 [Letrouitia transgressa]|nr:MAG: hypothetical protein LQ342_006435 [Letrouitia transgressa]